MSTNVKKDQRGVGALLVVIILLVLAAVGAAAYFVFAKNDDKKGTSNDTHEVQAAVSDACKKEVDDDDFCAWASGSGNIFASDSDLAYTATSVMNSAGEVSSTTVVAMDGKGNSHTKAEAAGGTYETIILNDVNYVKYSGQDVWYKLPAAEENPEAEDTPEPTFDFEDEDSTAEPASKTVYKNLGSENCGGKSAQKWQTYQEDTPNETFTVWFYKDDHRTCKMEIVGSDGSKWTTTYEYGDVTISEPSPVQDMPTGADFGL